LRLTVTGNVALLVFVLIAASLVAITCAALARQIAPVQGNRGNAVFAAPVKIVTGITH
jgi:hypothetical protein